MSIVIIIKANEMAHLNPVKLTVPAITIIIQAMM